MYPKRNFRQTQGKQKSSGLVSPELLLTSQLLSVISIAVTAVNRSIISRNEWNLGRRAAIGTQCIVQLPSAIPSVPPAGLSGITAGLAANRLILKSLFSVKLLLSCGENKLRTTIFAH
jgi:hypothetical protein